MLTCPCPEAARRRTRSLHLRDRFGRACKFSEAYKSSAKSIHRFAPHRRSPPPGDLRSMIYRKPATSIEHISTEQRSTAAFPHATRQPLRQTFHRHRCARPHRRLCELLCFHLHLHVESVPVVAEKKKKIFFSVFALRFEVFNVAAFVVAVVVAVR